MGDKCFYLLIMNFRTSFFVLKIKGKSSMESPRSVCLYFRFVISKNTSCQAQFKTQINFSRCNMLFILSVYSAGHIYCISVILQSCPDIIGEVFFIVKVPGVILHE